MTRPRSPFPTRHRGGTPAAAPPVRPDGPAPTRPGRSSDRDAGRIAAGLRRVDCCTLCGAAPAPWRGVWWPTAEISRRLGAAAGKTRVAVWALCSPCRELPDAITLVEDRILAEAAAGLARPESN